VKNTRVLLGTPSGLQTQILVSALQQHPDIELVGHVIDPVATLATMVRTKPDIWIHAWEEGPELQGMLSHVYSCHPAISVIRFNANEPAGYLQVRLDSLSSLLSAIRHSQPLEHAC